VSFCTACGQTMDPASAFCTKCGAKTEAPPPLTSATTASAAAAPAPAKSGGALKIVLIVLGVIFVLGITVVGGLIYMGKRMVDSAIQTTDDGKVTKVETPFGKFESSKDVKEVMEKIGVEVYPGATPVEDGTSSTAFGEVEITGAQFRTAATVDEVMEFYRGKYPDSQYVDLGSSKMLSMGDPEKSHVVINVSRDDGETETGIQISKTAKRQ
jgi:hypothetical protein